MDWHYKKNFNFLMIMMNLRRRMCGTQCYSRNTAVTKMAEEGKMPHDLVMWYIEVGLLPWSTNSCHSLLAIGFYDTFQPVVANAKAFPNLKWRGLLHYTKSQCKKDWNALGPRGESHIWLGLPPTDQSQLVCGISLAKTWQKMTNRYVAKSCG